MSILFFIFFSLFSTYRWYPERCTPSLEIQYLPMANVVNILIHANHSIADGRCQRLFHPMNTASCMFVSFFRPLCSLHTLAYANRVYANEVCKYESLWVNIDLWEKKSPVTWYLSAFFQLQARHCCGCCYFTAKENKNENGISIFVQFRFV